MPGLFDTPGDADVLELSPARRDELVAKLAGAVVSRNLTAPAIFFLESMKPLSFIGSQVMVFLDPLVRAVFDIKGYNDVRLMLERRENVDLLLQEIERQDAALRAKRREERKARKTT